MFLLSNDLISGLSDASPKSSVPVKGGTLCLYLGETSNTLRDHGLLNVVLWGDDSNAFGFDMADLESVSAQPGRGAMGSDAPVTAFLIAV